MSLVRADARQIPLVDGCVQCVVTSPPYWGLRDYGTARWDGGDPACDHKTGRFERGGLSVKQASNSGSAGDEARGDCGKCGAHRIDIQIGLEPTPDAYVQTLVAVFREVQRVLKDDGTVWLNLGDSYSRMQPDNVPQTKNKPVQPPSFRERNVGLPEKNLVGIPWRVAFALQADGWYLRSDIIWSKPNPMPESVTDRPTKAHEYIFLLSKSASYYYDADAIKEPSVDMAGWQSRWKYKLSGRPEGATVCPGDDEGQRYAPKGFRSGPDDEAGRNKRSVWHVATQPYAGSHFATFPEALIEPCILAGSRIGDRVFDPFIGSGTTGAVAERLMRRWVGTDLSYQHLAKDRTAQRGLRLEDTA